MKSLRKLIRDEFIETVNWLDDSDDTLAWRFSDDDQEIKNNAKLVCRPSQAAVFVNEGTLADVFPPGTHILSTQNLPILSTLRGWKYGFNSPFKAEVYFISQRQYVDRKWGTRNPVNITDPRFAVGDGPGQVPVRAFGSYGYCVTDPGLFFSNLVGTKSVLRSDSVEQFIVSNILQAFGETVTHSSISANEIVRQSSNIASAVETRTRAKLASNGLQLNFFTLESITLHPKVQAALEDAAVQAARGIDDTMAWEAMQAMRDVSRNAHKGQMTGAGAGMAMGRLIGQMASDIMGSGKPSPPQHPRGRSPHPQGQPQPHRRQPPPPGQPRPQARQAPLPGQPHPQARQAPPPGQPQARQAPPPGQPEPPRSGPRQRPRSQQQPRPASQAAAVAPPGTSQGLPGWMQPSVPSPAPTAGGARAQATNLEPELRRLASLHNQGLLSDDEYEKAKALALRNAYQTTS